MVLDVFGASRKFRQSEYWDQLFTRSFSPFFRVSVSWALPVYIEASNTLHFLIKVKSRRGNTFYLSSPIYCTINSARWWRILVNNEVMGGPQKFIQGHHYSTGGDCHINWPHLQHGCPKLFAEQRLLISLISVMPRLLYMRKMNNFRGPFFDTYFPMMNDIVLSKLVHHASSAIHPHSDIHIPVVSNQSSLYSHITQLQLDEQ